MVLEYKTKRDIVDFFNKHNGKIDLFRITELLVSHNNIQEEEWKYVRKNLYKLKNDGYIRIDNEGDIHRELFYSTPDKIDLYYKNYNIKISHRTIKYLKDIITGDSKKSEYKTGPKLIEFFNQFGYSDNYEQGFPSRGVFVQDKLNELNDKNKIKNIIENYYNPVNFISENKKLVELVTELNKYLEFDNLKLEITNKKSNLLKMNWEDGEYDLLDKEKENSNIVNKDIVSDGEVIAKNNITINSKKNTKKNPNKTKFNHKKEIFKNFYLYFGFIIFLIILFFIYKITGVNLNELK